MPAKILKEILSCERFMSLICVEMIQFSLRTFVFDRRNPTGNNFFSFLPTQFHHKSFTCYGYVLR